MSDYKSLYNSLKDFKFLWVLLLVVLVPSSILLIFTTYNQSLIPHLWNSSSNLLGILTSIFTHADFSHYFDNMSLLFGTILLFLLLNYFLDRKERKSRALFVFVAALSIGVIVNIIELLVPAFNEDAFGASGVVFAVIGILLGFSLLNLSDLIIRRGKARIGDKDTFIILNFLIAAGILQFVFLQPSAFFNVSQGVAFIEHELSFLFGFFSVFMLYFF